MKAQRSHLKQHSLIQLRSPQQTVKRISSNLLQTWARRCSLIRTSVTKEDANLLHSRERRAFDVSSKAGITSQAHSIVSDNEKKGAVRVLRLLFSSLRTEHFGLRQMSNWNDVVKCWEEVLAVTERIVEVLLTTLSCRKNCVWVNSEVCTEVTLKVTGPKPMPPTRSFLI